MIAPDPRYDRRPQWPARLMLLLVFVIGSSTFADLAAAKLVGWQLERGVDSPSYAVTEPTRTDLNIDTVALVCEGTDENRVVQLQLYLSDDGPLRPKNAGSQRFKVEPRAELLIDGRLFKVSILFADNYVVLADGRQGPFPRLSDAVLDAMAAGKRMVMRFDLMAERPGQAAAFDGEAVVDLQSGAGAAAVSAVRRCAEPEPGRPVGTAFAG